jgi:twitching motility protein PilT
MPQHDFREDTLVGQRIMQLAQSGSISDFYITPWETLCYKLNGELHRDESFIYTPTKQLDVVPGCFDYAIVLGPHRFRVNQLVTRGKLRWVMRLLPVQIPTAEQVSVPAPAIKAFLESKNGLFLVCGATGSGKSTTIASMVLHRAQRRREHVVTFEDPIEYVYPDNTASLISQREMGTDELDFGASLRAALRQAPDVINIGEIRDGQTAEIALQAAETGHVVVATLHTSTAAQTVARFLKLIPAERLESAQSTFADVMGMILCQRLMLDEEKGKRFAVHELLLQYDSVSNLIRRGEFKKLDQELEVGWKRGMSNFEQSMAVRAQEGWRGSQKNQKSGYSEGEVREYLETQEVLT